MTRPFPKLVSDGGKIVREALPILDPEVFDAMARAVHPSDNEAVTSDGIVVRRRHTEKALENFTRNLEATGLLDENGMVKKDSV